MKSFNCLIIKSFLLFGLSLNLFAQQYQITKTCESEYNKVILKLYENDSSPKLALGSCEKIIIRSSSSQITEGEELNCRIYGNIFSLELLDNAEIKVVANLYKDPMAEGVGNRI